MSIHPMEPLWIPIFLGGDHWLEYDGRWSRFGTSTVAQVLWKERLIWQEDITSVENKATWADKICEMHAAGVLPEWEYHAPSLSALIRVLEGRDAGS